MWLTHMDLSLAEHANALAARHDGVEDVASAYASASEALFLALVVALLAWGVVTRRSRVVLAGGLAGVAAGVALAGAWVVAHVVDRPRPFVSDAAIHPFLAHSADAGFPSDHATAAFAIAATLCLLMGVRALPVLLAAIALAVSRVLVGLHYPGDVAAGALLGVVVALGIVAAFRRLARVRPLVTRVPGPASG